MAEEQDFFCVQGVRATTAVARRNLVQKMAAMMRHSSQRCLIFRTYFPGFEAYRLRLSSTHSL